MKLKSLHCLTKMKPDDDLLKNVTLLQIPSSIYSFLPRLCSSNNYTLLLSSLAHRTDLLITIDRWFSTVTMLLKYLHPSIGYTNMSLIEHKSSIFMA